MKQADQTHPRAVLVAALLALGVAGLAAAGQAATITWTGGAGTGSWHTAANWDLNRVPGAGDDVSIPDLPATAAVTYSSGTTAVNSLVCDEVFNITLGTLDMAAASSFNNDFTLSQGTITGTGDILVAGAMTWSNGTMSGTGTTTIAPGVAWTWRGGVLTRSLQNDGAGTRLGTLNITINTPGVFRNRAGGTFDLQVDRFFSGTGAIDNQEGSLLAKSVGAGAHSVACATTNAGTISVEAGALEFTGTLTNTSTATVTAVAGTELRLAAASTFLAGSGLAIDGTLTFESGTCTIDPATSLASVGRVTISGGTADIGADAAIGTLTMSQGTLTGAGDILVTGAMTWTIGTMSGTGVTTVGPGVAWSLGSNNTVTLTRTLENQGTCNRVNAGTILINAPGIFRNLAGGAFAFQVDSGIGGSGSIDNQAGGLFVKAAGAGTSQVACAVTNAGGVRADAGVLLFTSGGVLTNTTTGSLSSAAGTEIRIAAGSSFAGGSSLVNGGTMSFTGGTSTIDPGAGFVSPGVLTVSGGTVSIGCDLTATTLNLTGTGALTGGGNILVTDSMTWSIGTMSGTGVTTVGPGVVWSWGGANTIVLSRILVNQGTCNRVSGGTFSINAPGVFRNLGTLAFQVDSGVGGSGMIENQAGALLIKSAGTGQSPLSCGVSNAGTLRVASGTLFLNGSFSNFAGTTLTGGTYEVQSTFKFNGANIVTNSASLVLDGAGAQILNHIGTNALTNFQFNAASGSLAIQSGKNLTVTPPLSNAGSVRIGPGASTLTANAGYQQTAGGTRLDGGTLASTALVDIQGGFVTGTGTVVGDLRNGGTVAAGASPGAISLTGDYTQTSAGRLEVELGGTAPGSGYDVLLVTGTSNLDGDLAVELIDGFAPAFGDTFDIVVAGVVLGEFATDNLPLDGPLGCVDPPQYLHAAVRLTTLDGVAITRQPEGATVCLGAPAVFTVGATGDSLTFQWRKDGEAIAGAVDSTLAIAAAGAGDAGDYDVVVTGSCGSVASDVATLVVETCGEQTGACCRQAGVCEVLSEADCGNADGSYQGDGVPCDPNPCPTTGVDEGTGLLAVNTLVASPNPCKGDLLIRYSLAGTRDAEIGIYDTAGRLVRRFAPNAAPGHEGTIQWDGRHEHGNPVASGIYHVRMMGGGRHRMQTVIMLR